MDALGHMTGHEEGPEKPAATWLDYVSLARPDHWVKHVLILPGIVLASMFRPESATEHGADILIGLLSAAAIASANYVLNEWLDSPFDAFNSRKASRPAVQKRLSRLVVTLEYVALAAGGLVLAALVSRLFLVVSATFLLSGVCYNVPPIRTKDVAFLDVLTESVNSPIRLTLGWAMVSATTLPPASLLLAYWMGGGFLMALKRLAEYRAARLGGQLESLARYRRSFGPYGEESLLLSAFLYSQLAAFFLALLTPKWVEVWSKLLRVMPPEGT
jgi:4-hydroxybenzoate polyprenyltransferase